VILSRDIILAYLRNNKVVFGLIEEAVQELEDKPRYKEPVLVAVGQKPQNGEDAKIQFMFETDRSKLHIEEKNGKVDYKELHLVQNVVEGQALARKVPAKQGIPGRTVTGKMLASQERQGQSFCRWARTCMPVMTVLPSSPMSTVKRPS
jgi:uncharacterized protein